MIKLFGGAAVIVLLFLAGTVFFGFDRSDGCEDVPRAIEIGFSDDITREEAYIAIKSLGLTPPVIEPPALNFTPVAILDHTVDEGEAQEKLKSYPEVNKVQFGNVYFTMDTTLRRAQAILSENNIDIGYISRASYMQTETPDGEEKEYMERFNKLPEVKAVNRVQINCLD